MANINGNEILFGIIGSVNTSGGMMGGNSVALFNGYTDSIIGHATFHAS